MPAKAMPAKVRNALVHYRSLLGVDGVEIRLHATVLYNSLYRADDELLINTHGSLRHPRHGVNNYVDVSQLHSEREAVKNLLPRRLAHRPSGRLSRPASSISAYAEPICPAETGNSFGLNHRFDHATMPMIP